MENQNSKIQSRAALLELGHDFYDEVQAASFPEAKLRYWNETAAKTLHLNNLSIQDRVVHFQQFKALPSNLQSCLAMKYHGHQFHHYNPDLGDGRGFSFAQFEKSVDQENLGVLLELGTKGSGQTPYSRNGDGRLTLKGAVREALATEYLQHLGVKTSKTFCIFETGESLHRHDEDSPTRSAVLTRLSHSHIRFGTFQRLAYLGQKENIEKLLNYCLKWLYPEIQTQYPNASPDELCAHFLRNIMERHADLVASYMIAGFVHGVLNSDNMNVSGESFDYGPYRFLPYYDPSFTAAYFDHQGLYCFGRQPISILWNLHRLGEALQLRFNELPVKEILEGFSDVFNSSVQKYFLRRMNLKAQDLDSKNQELLSKFFLMQENSKASYAQVFFDFHSGFALQNWKYSDLGELYKSLPARDFIESLKSFEVADEALSLEVKNRKIQAVSLYIDEIESIWKPIAENDDWSAFETKIQSFKAL